eukprot:2351192-Amphidinium_carterae.1
MNEDATFKPCQQHVPATQVAQTHSKCRCRVGKPTPSNKKKCAAGAGKLCFFYNQQDASEMCHTCFVGLAFVLAITVFSFSQRMYTLESVNLHWDRSCAFLVKVASGLNSGHVCSLVALRNRWRLRTLAVFQLSRANTDLHGIGYFLRVLVFIKKPLSQRPIRASIDAPLK